VFSHASVTVKAAQLLKCVQSANKALHCPQMVHASNARSVVVKNAQPTVSHARLASKDFTPCLPNARFVLDIARPVQAALYVHNSPKLKVRFFSWLGRLQC
jgi:hypothetical protein